MYRSWFEEQNGGLHQGLADVIQSAVLADLSRVHNGVAGNACSHKPLSLTLAGALHPRPHPAELSPKYIVQLLIFHPRHLHVDVNPVHQRTGNTLLVTGHCGRRAGARPGGVTKHLQSPSPPYTIPKLLIISNSQVMIPSCFILT